MNDGSSEPVPGNTTEGSNAIKERTEKINSDKNQLNTLNANVNSPNMSISSALSGDTSITSASNNFNNSRDYRAALNGAHHSIAWNDRSDSRTREGYRSRGSSTVSSKSGDVNSEKREARTKIASHELSNSSLENLNSLRPLNSPVDNDLNDAMNTMDNFDLNNLFGELNYKSLKRPKYMRVHRRHSNDCRQLNHLFCAQELKVSESGVQEEDEAERKDFESSFSESTDGNDLLSNNESVDRDNLGPEPKKVPSGESQSGGSSEQFVMQFSLDGKYLAIAGRDQVIRIWQVISSPLGRLKQDELERKLRQKKLSHGKSANEEEIWTPIFHQFPVRVLKSHTDSVLSLDWSKNNFLISGSMDQTAKLWHVDVNECLATFHHEEFVTAVKFHPNDDRFFLSGSLDNSVRLWSILERNVVYSKDLEVDTLITALAVSPDGDFCIVGGFNGCVVALEVKGLFVLRYIHLKKKSFGHYVGGNKITGISVIPNEELDESDTVRSITRLRKWSFLITTNDSKIRLIRVEPKKIVLKFKGFTNNYSSISASLSPDYKYVIAGSEDHWCYVWENEHLDVSHKNHKVKHLIKELVTNGKSHLANLPLSGKNESKPSNSAQLSDKEEDQSSYVTYDNNKYACFHAHHSRVNSAIFVPESTKRLLQLSDDPIYALLKVKDRIVQEVTKEKQTPCNNQVVKELNLSSENTDIIVTTDNRGNIRVYRQDSGYAIRKKIIEKLKTTPKSEFSRGRDYPDISIQRDRGISLGSALRLDFPEIVNVGKMIQTQARSLTPCVDSSARARASELRQSFSQKNTSKSFENMTKLLNESSLKLRPHPEITRSSSLLARSSDNSETPSMLHDGEVVFELPPQHDEDEGDEYEQTQNTSFDVKHEG